MDLKGILSDIQTGCVDRVGSRRTSSQAITEFRRRSLERRKSTNALGEFQQHVKEKMKKMRMRNKKKSGSRVDPENFNKTVVQIATEKLENLLKKDIGKKILQQVKNSATCHHTHPHTQQYIPII